MAKEYEIAFKLGAQLQATFSKTFGNASKAVEVLQKNMKDLRKEKPPDGGFDKMQKEAKSTQSQVSKLDKEMQGLNGTLKTVGAAAGAFVLVQGASGAISGMTGAIGGFDSAMTKVQMSTGASAAEMAELKAASKNLYNQGLGEDWNDLAESMSKAKQVTGEQGAALESSTKNAVMYRDVFGEDIAASVKTADTMVKNFGVTNDQAFNLLAQGAQKGLDKSGELLDSANEYSPHFQSLGFSANQMFDTFSAGLETGAFNLDKVGYSAHYKLLLLLGRLKLIIGDAVKEFIWYTMINKIISREAEC
ncbi:phage tail tape measure protein [Paenibacillus sp. FJAT-26967]|uniref:phage tail tape measure protein n=1 Tax=Paenibacillus sp. FJAT-26967 TaxID=1729690 RepID=UPI000839A314|nr:phage tail tape measure protein [Paenibacillus sp. FJAT-26967]